jgi:twitching motility protein PilJ
MALDPALVKKSPEAAALTAEAIEDAFRYTELAPADAPPAPAPRAKSRRARPGTQSVEAHRPAPVQREGLLERFLAWELPWLGKKPINVQVQTLMILMGLFSVIAVAVLLLDVRDANNNARQSALVGDTLMHTQRLAKAAPNAIEGNRTALAELKDSRDRIAANLDALANGDAQRGMAPSPSGLQPALSRLGERWKVSETAASLILAQEKTLSAYGDMVKRINDTNPRLLQLAEEISAMKLQQAAPAREIAAAGQLVMLTQRMAKSVNALMIGDVGRAEVALTLGRDINLFRDLTQSLLNGNEALRIAPAADSETRTRLVELGKTYTDLQAANAAAVSNLQAIVQTKDAEQVILRDSEPLREQVTKLQEDYTREQAGRIVNFWVIVIAGIGVLLSAVGVVKVLLDDTRRRATEAEKQRAEAQKLEEEAKRTNEQNQAAILRLMNELQEVADGNLTVQATVTEDITGAIADSVNYTVEELRGLVGRINVTAEQVNSASTQARDIATRLLTASEAQSREIKDTGDKVLRMAAQINDVSRSAGESAKVARASLDAAERGQRAVYNQIAGMNEIREQIQETSKRIKRLGESSQEIGEIVELISDITEQTNVLALNAAIQAATAGEAGRGFSVVAEEVQRLADRSAEAAKQIGALVRTIQTDTQDAVAAMEKSTQGVVEGTKLSDAAGTALADIGRVSRQLAELIERIAGNTQEQATSAGGVAESIERILSVTEQTSQGTRQAAQSIGQLATLARELKASVARFRVG